MAQHRTACRSIYCSLVLTLNFLLTRNLAEHIHRVKPNVNLFQLQRTVDLCNDDALDINQTTMRFDGDLFSSASAALVSIRILPEM
jgi:hypothetical protein